MLWQLLANGLVSAGQYALIALGLALIYNTTRILHIAHGASFTIGAYAFFFFLVRLEWTLPLAALAALAVAALAGLAAELVVYRPLERRGASLLVALLSSLGAYVAIVNLVALLFGNEVQVLRAGAARSLHFGSVILTEIQLAQVATAVVVVPAVLLFLRKSTLGRKIRSVRDNPELVRVIGVDPGRLRLLVFGLGSALAGLAALFQAYDVGMDPQVGLPTFLAAAVCLIVGGVGTFEGPVVGALVLGLLQSLVTWKISADWTDAITFGVLIAFLLLRPRGLLGRRLRLEAADS